MKELFGVIGLVCVFVIQFNTFISKSEIEREFLTSENKIKMKYFKLIGLSFSISYLSSYGFYLVNSLVRNVEFDLNKMLANFFIMVISSFTIFLFLYPIIKRLVPHHYKVKVDFEELGSLYLIKMLNESICLCSSNPNIEYSKAREEYIPIKVEDFTKRMIILEKIRKPKTSGLSGHRIYSFVTEAYKSKTPKINN